jgi:hypothetical protein
MLEEGGRPVTRTYLPRVTLLHWKMVCTAEGVSEHGQRVGRRREREARTPEYVREVSDQPQGQLQTLLDEKDAREWHLVGVVGGLPGGGIVFFWDTERPSFGRRSL